MAVTGTPAILIPFPYAAEMNHLQCSLHGSWCGAGVSQAELTPQLLESKVLSLLHSPGWNKCVHELGTSQFDGAERLAALMRQLLAT